MRGSRIFSRNRGGKGYFCLSGDGGDVRGLVLVISYVNYKKKFEFSRSAHAIDKKKPLVDIFVCRSLFLVILCVNLKKKVLIF